MVTLDRMLGKEQSDSILQTKEAFAHQEGRVEACHDVLDEGQRARRRLQTSEDRCVGSRLMEVSGEITNFSQHLLNSLLRIDAVLDQRKTCF